MQNTIKLALLEGTYLLQKLDESLEEGFRAKYIADSLKLHPGQSLEDLINKELIHLQNQYQMEEDEFVEKVILEEPPVVQARKRACNRPKLQKPEQIQRAEACRKSRLRAKVKKTKQRLRLQFCNYALKEHRNVMSYVSQVVDCAEAKLIQAGFDKNVLFRMREAIGLKDLKEIGLDNIDNNNI